MTQSSEAVWRRFQERYVEFPSLGLAIDLSRMQYEDAFPEKMRPRLEKAFEDMAALEKGSIANRDETRMVGHYWLRNPDLAPTTEIRNQIKHALCSIHTFAQQVHGGQIRGATGPFKNLLLIGIGGSALGPQFVSAALSQPGHDKLQIAFFDNTDPDGMDKVMADLRGQLGQTLCLVVSKSGGTAETRNGMIEADAAYKRAGLAFPQHAVCITKNGSKLHQQASEDRWLRIFPMWDWVGGRTSETAAVGLLPAALQGFDIDQLLAGACACDEVTRAADCKRNPAALMALGWYHGCDGHGSKDLVILPYKDRLSLLARYLQQLIMESLGKEKNVNDIVVNQGLTVYGNKGSTDQHAYVQQLREGVNNFFVTFIEVLKDRDHDSIFVDPNTTSGDYLTGFFLGTREALSEKGRQSITLTIREITPFTIGVLIALFERCVGLYASMIEINAYHQPGVEAGKKAAEDVLKHQLAILSELEKHRGDGLTVDQIAEGIVALETLEKVSKEVVFKTCEHLAANPDRGIRKMPGTTQFNATYKLAPV